MFKFGEFKSSAGKRLNWKIECDSLSRGDVDTICELIHARTKFCQAVSPPTNSPFVQSLVCFLNRHHKTQNGKTYLIVDDVLTTGKSMVEKRKDLISLGVKSNDIKGVVLYARGRCPYWVTPIFTLHPGWK